MTSPIGCVIGHVPVKAVSCLLRKYKRSRSSLLYLSVGVYYRLFFYLMIRVVRICGLTQIIYDLRVYFSRFSVFIRYFHLKRNIRTAFRYYRSEQSRFVDADHSIFLRYFLFSRIPRFNRIFFIKQCVDCIYMQFLKRCSSAESACLVQVRDTCKIHCFIYRAVFRCSVSIRLRHPLPESAERMLPPIQIIIDVRTIFIIAQTFLLRGCHVLFFR